jgi:hypothetical protein
MASATASHCPARIHNKERSMTDLGMSHGTEIRARDIRAEEALLEEILGSLDERRSRFDDEVRAEAAAAISRLGADWGRPDYSDELDVEARGRLLDTALADEEALAVIRGYVAHLHEHRAEFCAKVFHSSGTEG